MELINKLKDFLNTIDQKTFYKYLTALIGFFLLIMFGLIWRYYSNIDTLLTKIKNVNRQRIEIQNILTELAQVKLQEREVKELLDKDKNFRIAEFLHTIVKELDLTKNLSKDPDPIENELENGYIEVKLDPSFTDLDMKQLTDLLYKIDQNEKSLLQKN